MCSWEVELKTTKSLPRTTVIIPSLKGNTAKLESALSRQTLPPDEVCVVSGVSPSGRARNQGVLGSNSDLLIFIDDDAIPGTPDLLEKLLEPLLADPTVGVTGAARRLPADASWFQHRVAIEIPRMVNPVPDDFLETNPTLQGYGHSLITTTCCALRRQVFDQAGKFRADLISGEDADFFYRVRRLGYRFLMVPHTYVEHPLPDSLPALVHKFLWYGQGYSQEALLRPEQRIGPRLHRAWQRSMFILAASTWLLPNIFVLYSLSYPYWELGFRPLKALSTYAVAWGYVKEWSRYARSGNL